MKTLALTKREMKVAGGLEKVASLILGALQNEKAEVSLLTQAQYKPKGLSKTAKIKDFDRWLYQKSRSFDVVLSMDRSSFQTHHRAGNGVHAAYLDLRSKTEGRLKKWSFAASSYHRLELKLEKETFESLSTQVIIVNSAMVASQIQSYYNTPASKIHVVHNGINYKGTESDFASSLENRDQYAKLLGLDLSVFQFIFIGHNFQRKGLAKLIQALSLLPTREFHLSVVGTDKQIKTYQTLSSRLGLSKQITFFGQQQDTKPFYLAADALVIPSIYDPFANVTVEALSFGLFVISSKTNGGHEVLHPHSGCTLEDARDLEELKEALIKALSRPKTAQAAVQIRQTVAHLDHSQQLKKICSLCLG